MAASEAGERLALSPASLTAPVSRAVADSTASAPGLSCRASRTSQRPASAAIRPAATMPPARAGRPRTRAQPRRHGIASASSPANAAAVG